MRKSPRNKLMASALGAGAAMTLLASAGPALAAETFVAKGSDYFQTAPGSFFVLGGNNIELVGNPIGPSNTDTIIQRPENIPLNDVTPSEIKITALSMESATPVPGLGEVYVTLDPNHLANDLGTINIDGTAAGGTFNSTLNVWFDVCTGGFGANGVGCGGGSTYTTGEITLSQSGAPWSSTPRGFVVSGPFGDLNANLHTGLPEGYVDFFPGVAAGGGIVSVIKECNLSNGCHDVLPAPGPVPGTGLLALAFLSLAGVATRARRFLQG